MPTMTVGDIKAMLEDFEDTDEIYFAYPSGDYWRTTIARNVSSIDYENIEYSDYHEKHVIHEEDSSVESKTVVVIR